MANVSSGRGILRLLANMICLLDIEALRSPCVEGPNLEVPLYKGGFSGGCEIPPSPPLEKGGFKVSATQVYCEMGKGKCKRLNASLVTPESLSPKRRPYPGNLQHRGKHGFPEQIRLV